MLYMYSCIFKVVLINSTTSDYTSLWIPKVVNLRIGEWMMSKLFTSSYERCTMFLDEFKYVEVLVDASDYIFSPDE